MARARSPGEATERPTPERQREARRRGQVAVSADLSAALGLGAALVVFAGGAGVGVTRLLRYFHGALEQAAGVGSSAGTGAGVQSAFADAGRAAVAAALPVVALPGAVGVAAVLLFGALQTGGLFAWSGARPGPARGALPGLRRLFSGATALEGARSLLKVALVFAVAGTALAPLARGLPELARATPTTILVALGHLALRVAVRVTVALIVWGIADWVLARWRQQRTLAMTRDEVRHEQKEREGDPRRRAERRRWHQELAAEPPLPDAVREAAVVVVGVEAGGVVAATVAYQDASGRAPTVTAVGRGPVAEHIERLAREVAVAVMHDDALVAALAAVPAGGEIPESLFDAVAALLRPTRAVPPGAVPTRAFVDDRRIPAGRP